TCPGGSAIGFGWVSAFSVEATLVSPLIREVPWCSTKLGRHKCRPNGAAVAAVAWVFPYPARRAARRELLKSPPSRTMSLAFTPSLGPDLFGVNPRGRDIVWERR